MAGWPPPCSASRVAPEVAPQTPRTPRDHFKHPSQMFPKALSSSRCYSSVILSATSFMKPVYYPGPHGLRLFLYVVAFVSISHAPPCLQTDLDMHLSSFEAGTSMCFFGEVAPNLLGKLKVIKRTGGNGRETLFRDWGSLDRCIWQQVARADKG